jgi:soluble cytochrome b562
VGGGGGELRIVAIFQRDGRTICAPQLSIKGLTDSELDLQRAKDFYRDYFTSTAIQECRETAEGYLISRGTLSAVKVLADNGEVADWTDEFRVYLPSLDDRELRRREEDNTQQILDAAVQVYGGRSSDVLDKTAAKKVEKAKYKKLSSEEEVKFYLHSGFDALVKRLQTVTADEGSGLEIVRAAVLLSYFRPNTFAKLCFWVDFSKAFQFIDGHRFEKYFFQTLVESDNQDAASVVAKFLMLKTMDDGKKVDIGKYFEGFVQVVGTVRDEHGKMFKVLYKVKGTVADLFRLIPPGEGK